MAKLSDRPEQKLGVEVLQYRVSDLETKATAVKTATAAMLAGDTTGQFADDAALIAAFETLRDSYTGLVIPGLGDSTDLFTVE
jgi:hypothetical protein